MGYGVEELPCWADSVEKASAALSLPYKERKKQRSIVLNFFLREKRGVVNNNLKYF
jgi:hypothetical protein